MFGGRVTPVRAVSQNQFHSIISDAHFDPSLCRHGPESGGDSALITADDFRSAMGDDCARHPFFLAPCQLRPHSRVTDQCFAASANERSRESGAIPDVKFHAVQRRVAIVNEDQIRR